MSVSTRSLRPSPAIRIPVLMYHQIGTPGSCGEARYTVDPRTFARQMEALAADGYQACSLSEFLDWHAGKDSLEDKKLLITFDDGFCGVHDEALPVLRSLGWPFTVFIVTDKLGRVADWIADSAAGGREGTLMNDGELDKLLAAGAAIESHTATHCDLSTLSDAQLADELERSRLALLPLTGKPARALAYPYGRHDERVTGFAQRVGYEAAFSVNPGFNRPDTPALALRRLDVYGSDSAGALLRKVRLGSNDGSLAHGARYLVGRAHARVRSVFGLKT